MSLLQAELIEYNAEAVDSALNAVRSALARGLSWRELGDLIKVRQHIFALGFQ